jgi:hypothetical protein
MNPGCAVRSDWAVGIGWFGLAEKEWFTAAPSPVNARCFHALSAAFLPEEAVIDRVASQVGEIYHLPSVIEH